MQSPQQQQHSVAVRLFERHAKRDDNGGASAFPSATLARVDGPEAFVISMNDERWDATHQRLVAAGMQPVRWPGVDGVALSKDREATAIVHPRVLYSLLNTPVCLHDVETWGTIGCYLSHWSIWYHVVQNRLPAVIVFEDDIVPRYDRVGTQLSQQISALMREAGGPSNFDFMRFEWVPLTGAVRERYSSNLYRSRGLVVNMGAYVVTYRGAQRLLRRALPVSDPIDMLLTYIERTAGDEFVSLLSRNVIAVQDRRNFKSQIATNKERRDRHETLCRVENMMRQRPNSSDNDEGRGTNWSGWYLVGSLSLAVLVGCVVYYVASRGKKSNGSSIIISSSRNGTGGGGNDRVGGGGGGSSPTPTPTSAGRKG